MRKTLFALVVAVMMTAGTASADRGFWYGGGTGNTTAWITVINALNQSGTAVTATVTFFKLDKTSMGSTTRVLQSNEGWNFTTATVGNLAGTVFDAATTSGGTERGSVLISGAGSVVGYTSIFNMTNNSGFNFRW
ncbi:MAG: hypothetical protein OEY64_09900 [Nitrospinota bacterium]|nr:hypothetical protein [Nitrospinota bacterium]